MNLILEMEVCHKTKLQDITLAKERAERAELS